MEVTHALWERRNMGLDCWEATVARGDRPEACLSELEALAGDYFVVRVPEGMPCFGIALQDHGFRYMESMVSLHRSAELPALNPLQDKLVEQSNYAAMGEGDHARLFAEIRGGMFHTDRVALDPYFTAEQAANRYVGWIQDELARGTELFKVQYKGRDAGFFGFKETRTGVYFPFLAGLYPGGARVLGLGYALNYLEIAEAHRRGARSILGNVSTNNLASLAALTSFGYVVDGVTAVYIRHGMTRKEQEI